MDPFNKAIAQSGDFQPALRDDAHAFHPVAAARRHWLKKWYADMRQQAFASWRAMRV